MTQFIDGTKDNEQIKTKKKFVLVILGDGTISQTTNRPEQFDIVKLIRRRDTTAEYDLMVAYDKKEEYKNEYLHLGHWDNGC